MVGRLSVDLLSSSHVLSSDSVGSVAFHPITARLLSSSGSRNFDDSGSSDSEDSVSDSDDSLKGTATSVSMRRRKRQPSVRDNSLKLWRF